MKRSALVFGAIALAALVIAVVTVVAVAADPLPRARVALDSPRPGNVWGPGTIATEQVTWDDELAFQTCCNDSVQAADFSRSGGGEAFRSYLRYGDAPVADGVRAETHTARWDASRFGTGDIAYYGFSVYLVSTWEADSAEDIVFQWHTEPEECEDDKPPSAFLSLRPEGTWRLRVNADDAACTSAGSVTKSGFDLGAAEPGRWHDFVFAFKWDATDAGGTKVWHQTDLDPGWDVVLDVNGANAFADDKATGYLKWGLYKPAWNLAPTDVDARVIYHDNIAFGDQFAAVDPSH